MIRRIQREGAEALLNVGVSFPLCRIRMPWKKETREWRVTMHRPTLRRQIKISREWLSTNTSLEDFRKMDYEAQLEWLVKHGKALSRIIALALGWRLLPLWLSAWIVRRYIRHEYLICAMDTYVSLMGTASFMSIISSVEITNPMKLRLSQMKKGS